MFSSKMHFSGVASLLLVFQMSFGCGDSENNNDPLQLDAAVNNDVEPTPPENSNEGKAMAAVTIDNSFTYKDEATWDEQNSLIEELKTKSNIQKKSLEDILADSNHDGKKISSLNPPSNNPLSIFHIGFNFDSDDTASCWRPQGLTGTADAYPKPGTTSTGRKLLVVSWHGGECGWEAEDDRGVRITFIDVTDMDHIKYRHTLLVEPYTDTNGNPNFKSVPINAGGISWVGNYLYVVDTNSGFRVFDIKAMMEADTTSSGHDSNIGIVGEKAFAYDFKYIIPQVNKYVYGISNDAGAKDSPIRFSWMSLDSSTTPPSFITGEWKEGSPKGRVFRWKLDVATNKLQVDANTKTFLPYEGYVINQNDIQGGFSRIINGVHKYWFTGKKLVAGKRYYYLFRKTTSKLENDYHWALETAQNLHYSPTSDNFWSLTGTKDKNVFSVKLSDVNDFCKNPENCLIACTNNASNKIEVYDANASDWNNANALKWEWAPEEKLGFDNENKKEIDNWTNGAPQGDPMDVKLRNSTVWTGSTQVIVAVGGQMAIIARYKGGTKGQKLWARNVGAGAYPHAIELLENGNVAIVATHGNWLRIYNTKSDTSAPLEITLTAPHGVVWDPVRERLWVLAQDDLLAYKVEGTREKPTLSEKLRKSFSPYSGTDNGHDLSAFFNNPDKLLLTATQGVYLYDKNKNTFSVISKLDKVKSISNLPNGYLVMPKPKDDDCKLNDWCSPTVNFFDGKSGELKATRTKTGMACYKADVFVADYLPEE